MRKMQRRGKLEGSKLLALVGEKILNENEIGWEKQRQWVKENENKT